MIFQYLQHASFDNLVGGFEKWTMFSDTDKVVPPSDVRWFIIPMNYRYNLLINPSEIGLICTKLANYNNRSDPSY